MAFDAGTIIARLDLDTQDFDRKLRAAQARARQSETAQDRVRLSISPQQAGQFRRQMEQLDRQVTQDAVRRGSSGHGSLMSTLLGLSSPNAGRAQAGQQAQAQQSFLSRLAKGIGPGILGLGTKGSLIAGGVAAGGALLPSLLGGLAPLGVAGVGVGALGVAFKGANQQVAPLLALQQRIQNAQLTAVSPAQQKALAAQTASLNQAVSRLPAAQQQMYRAQSQISNWWQNFTGAMAPMFAKSLTQVSHLLQGLSGPLNTFFKSAFTLASPLIHGLGDIARMLLPLLGKAFRAAAPLLRPLLDGLGRLVAGILPGLITLMHAAAPAVRAVADVLGILGKGLGGFFAAMAPAIRASDVVLRAVGSVLATLLPVIGKLAGIFAQALAPVLRDFARVLKALEPSLVILGRVFAALAGAILKDLVSAFGALARLLIDIQPAIKIFAGALSRVFTVLENSGVFAALGSALEKIVPSLARLINLVAQQLAPVLPQIITLITQLSIILINLLAAGLTTVLTGITALLTHFPILTKLILAAAVAWGILAIAEAATGIGLIIIVIVAIIGALTLLVKHWDTVWKFIKSVASDAWNFLTHGWGQFLIPQLTLIRLAIGFVRDHWKQAWGDIKGAALDAWHFLDNDIFQPIKRLLLNDFPSWWSQAVSAVRTGWHAIENVVRTPVAWVIDHVINGLISAFDWVSSKVGGPHISAVHPFGLQRGGRLPGYGGGDVLPALLEPGETVVSKDDSRHPAMLAAFRHVGVPGYARGGGTGQGPIGAGQARTGLDPSHFHGTTSSIFSKAADIAKAVAAVATGNTKALTNAISGLIPSGTGGATGDMARLLADVPARLLADAVHTLLGFGGGGLGGRGADVARYAMSFAGKIPYVWGGTAVPGGADCSGFVQSVYRHFGITAPRTSEGQGAWVKRGAPQTGGLALYNSPAGGPPPGHVAIVGFKGNVISQGGGLGPQIVPLRSMPLMFTGVPPGHAGLGNVGPGDLAGLERLWTGAGGPGGLIAHIAGAIGMAESGGRSIKQQGQPPGLTGWGPWQITPTSGISQNGMFGNLLNSANNARAAVWLWRHAGNSFRPWVTFNDGAYRSFMDKGGWLHPGANIVQNSTGQREAVLNPSQSQAFMALAAAVHENRATWPGTTGMEAKLDRLIAAVRRNAGETGAAVGDALNGATRSAAYRSRYSVSGV
jgi:hypothetical protein